MQVTIHTVGHSTLSWDDFLAILQRGAIEVLCDIRSAPGSRKFPHFSGRAMEGMLADAGIAYRWLPELGGRRKHGLGERSPNKALRSASFRNYADYMQSAEFRTALAGLVALASERRVAIMCAESVFFNCHRRLVADALVAQGVRVLHLQQHGKPLEHQLPPEARVADGRVTYPGAST